MSFDLLYFAWVRERIGTGAETVTPPAGVATVGALLDWLATRSPGHAAALADRSALRFAVDEAFVGEDAPLGREIAIFPPVTGVIAVRVQAGPFDLGAEAAALSAGRVDIGAVVTFTGLVRDGALELEHWPGRADRAMAEVAAEAWRRWPLLAGTVVHRFGALEAGEPIVLVAVAAAHRAPAFEAAAFLMDWLKTRAPFWKREAGGEWVAARDADDAAARRWGTG